MMQKGSYLMTLMEQLTADMKEAMKQGEKERLSVNFCLTYGTANKANYGEAGLLPLLHSSLHISSEQPHQ